MDNNLFYGHEKRLVKEGWLKSVLIALIIGSAAMLAVATVTWVLEANGLWHSLLTLLVFTGGLSPLFYYTRFKPTAKQIARRIDKLGLEERAITMTELSDADSCMAKLQRADARDKIKSTGQNQIKYCIPAVFVVLLCVFGILGLGATTVNTLSFYGVIPTIGRIIDDTRPPEPIIEFEVSYFVEGAQGGVIEGEEFQIVEQGQNASTVYARAEEGWVFQGWSDGLPEPYRSDINVQGNLEAFAVFEQLGGQGDEGGEPSDQPADQPGQNQGNGNQGNNQNNTQQGGGRYEPGNQIIDEEVYYRDVYKQYYDVIVELLSSGAEIPEDLRILIEAYFNIIK